MRITLLKGYNKVDLLGTVFTMERDYLRDAFVNRGIEYGIVKESTVKELQDVILNMKNEHGIEAVILGCTELPLALNEHNVPVPCIDIMECHINKLVELIME